MGERFKTTLWVIGYALVAGLLLTLFSMIDSLIKYVFSLLVLYIGIRFFRRFETIGVRIGFFVLAFFFYLLTMVITQAVIFMQNNPPPGS